MVAGADLAVPAPATNDGHLALAVKRALWTEPVLSKLNLGVRVSQGVVTVHGPVPHAAIVEQAVGCVRRVPGVRDVVSELYVVAADAPLAKAVPEPVTARFPVPSTGASPALSPALPADSHRAGEPAAMLLPPVAAPAAPAQTLIEQVAQIRDRDRRFRDIRIEVRGGRVILRGTVDKAQDAWEFARLVRTLPGVAGVTQGVATAP
jgi:hypothetical protein